MCLCSVAGDDAITAKELLAQLRCAVDAANGKCKFNINRSKIWESAKRTFLRPTYSPQHAMSVKFTDDIGVSEGAVDQGGPTRELLQLLVDHLSNSSLFIGPPDSKQLHITSNGKQPVVYKIVNRILDK